MVWSWCYEIRNSINYKLDIIITSCFVDWARLQTLSSLIIRSLRSRNWKGLKTTFSMLAAFPILNLCIKNGNKIKPQYLHHSLLIFTNSSKELILNSPTRLHPRQERLSIFCQTNHLLSLNSWSWGWWSKDIVISAINLPKLIP